MKASCILAVLVLTGTLASCAAAPAANDNTSATPRRSSRAPNAAPSSAVGSARSGSDGAEWQPFAGGPPPRLPPMAAPFPKPGVSPLFGDARRVTKPEIVLFAGADAIVHTQWLASGDAVAHSGRSLFRIGADGTVTRTTFGAGIVAVAASPKNEIVAVLTDDNVVRVPLANEPAQRRFAVGAEPARPAMADQLGLPRMGRYLSISANGRVLGVTEYDALKPVTRYIDLAAGREISRGDGIGGRFTHDGDFVAVGGRTSSVVTGAEIHDTLAASTTAWIGSRQVKLMGDSVDLVDAARGAVASFADGCEGFIDSADVIDLVDHRVVRECATHMLVVDVDRATARKIKLTPPARTIPEHHAAREIAFSKDDERIVMWWQGARPEEDTFTIVTPSTGKAEATQRAALPTLRWAYDRNVRPTLDRAGSCSIGASAARSFAWCGVDANAQGSFAAAVNGGVTIVDATGAERVRLGPAPPPSSLSIPRIIQVRAGGLDVYDATWPDAAWRFAMRVGGEADAPPDRATPSRPTGLCRSARTMRRLPHRQSAMSISHSDSEQCQCNDDGCFSGGREAVDTRDGRELFIHEKPRRSFQEKRVWAAVVRSGREVVRSPELGRCSAGAFSEDGKTVVLWCERENGNELVELAMPKLGIARRVRVDGARSEGVEALTVSAGAVVIVDGQQGDRTDAHIVRRADGGSVATLHVWSQGAVARFPDGRVELFGAKAADGLACDENGRVVPFEKCRAAFEVKGRLKL